MVILLCCFPFRRREKAWPKRHPLCCASMNKRESAERYQNRSVISDFAHC